jgi:hypothetical protein
MASLVGGELAPLGRANGSQEVRAHLLELFLGFGSFGAELMTKFLGHGIGVVIRLQGRTTRGARRRNHADAPGVSTCCSPELTAAYSRGSRSREASSTMNDSPANAHANARGPVRGWADAIATVSDGHALRHARPIIPPPTM